MTDRTIRKRLEDIVAGLVIGAMFTYAAVFIFENAERQPSAPSSDRLVRPGR